MNKTIKTIKGGVTKAISFKAAGAHVGLKRKRKDLAILSSDIACDYAATFTTSTAKAAPVVWNKNLLDQKKKIKGLVVNSGNANSCTGPQGLVHAGQMAQKVATMLGCRSDEILVSSTGIIGVPLPIDAVLAGIETVAAELGYEEEDGNHAADAIMTTDSYNKQLALQFEIDGKTITMGAMAKGSGMLHPNMATMLSFITTDLSISALLLQKALSESVSGTYNMISVDADTSTNDMVVILANGAAGNNTIESEDENFELFCRALD
ncbi:MAG: bifunctional ornithine acetyltransferase/N-acetylglutamate synthase, partial [Candidatus Obscuribacterales bacterium]|nr:bifunctional ornithine acetyltransferase/N-acetylglutamate synthase [Candidatus Obscuribacterales bacterium]